MMELNQYSRRINLRDGTPALIRAIRPDDKQSLLDGFHRLTGRSVYFRFFSAKRSLTENELKIFTEIDFEHHVAIIASIQIEDKEIFIGVGRYIELKDKKSERVAEIAFAVYDEYQNLGVGTILFEQIVTIAQKKGITSLEADVLLENKSMLDIFENSGFILKTTIANDIAHIEFKIAGLEFKQYYREP